MIVSGLYISLSVTGGLIPSLQFGLLAHVPNSVHIPGMFLYNSFGIMAYYPAVYLIYNGALIGARRDSLRSFFVSTLMFLPMLSLSVLFRFMLDSSFIQTVIGGWMLTAFTASGAIMVSAATSLVLMLLVFQVGVSIPKARRENDDHGDSRNTVQSPIHLLPSQTISNDLIISTNSRENRTENRAENRTRENIRSLLQTTMTDFSSQRHSPDEENHTVTEDTMAENTVTEDIEAAELDEQPELITLNFGIHNSRDSHARSADYPEVEVYEPKNEKIQAIVDLAPEDYIPMDDLPVSEPDSPPAPAPLPREEVSSQGFRYEDDGIPAYNIPVEGILHHAVKEHYWVLDEDSTMQAALLRSTLEDFGIEAEVTGVRKGPVITMFEILPAPGVKLSRIVNLADNIALSLAATSVRIVAPIPGKHALGIEVPNKKRYLVTFSEILLEDDFKNGDHALPIALGKNITGEAQIIDLAKTPHLLIAGATGAGKSVCVNSLITSLLYRRSAEEVKMILIDPKIVELKFYNGIPHLLTPVITDPKKAFQALQWCLFEMERRYSLLDTMAVRDIKSYNRKITGGGKGTGAGADRVAGGGGCAGTAATAADSSENVLPYIVVVVDEFADLMATSGKELESTLSRLAAMSRAVGIHLVLATQRPSTDVITGLIKANIPSRIAFMVASKVDSRIIIDSMGAEKLLGKGDMLLTSAWDPFPQRIQGAYLSEEEVERVVEQVRKTGDPEYIDDEIFIGSDDGSISGAGTDDPLMEQAIDIVCSAQKASASYLQRRLSIGYNRAARLIEEMENMGIVGPQNGSKAREILRHL